MNYLAIVKISNEIRFVLNTSRVINLAAINASLAARQAGNAKGFQSVTVALKKFSQDLTDSMFKMTRDIFTIAQTVSKMSRQQHLVRHQQSALNLGGQSELLIQTLDMADSRQQMMLKTLNAQLRRLKTGFLSLQRLCNNGRVIARSALIEASAITSAENLLRKVALDIERTVSEIYKHLKSVETYLDGNVAAV